MLGRSLCLPLYVEMQDSHANAVADALAAEMWALR
jgi:dTDP-4-amino-4,6-dideoxygalactose transaminase